MTFYSHYGYKLVHYAARDSSEYVLCFLTYHSFVYQSETHNFVWLHMFAHIDVYASKKFSLLICFISGNSFNERIGGYFQGSAAGQPAAQWHTGQNYSVETYHYTYMIIKAKKLIITIFYIDNALHRKVLL